MCTVSHPKTAEQHRIFLLLQERIVNGRYAAGLWLPTERELADEFAVNRSVIRGAFAKLEEYGLIVRESGKRPWVRQRMEQAPHPAETIQQASSMLAAIMPGAV